MSDLEHLPDGNLAIITPTLGKATEISQRRHVRELFGGRTVVICKSVEAGFTTDRPVLETSSKGRSLPQRALVEFGKAVQTVRYRASNVPFGPDRWRMERFLRDHKVFAILAEFGHLGSTMAPVGSRLGIPVFTYFRGYDASKRLASPLRVLNYRAALPRLAGYFSVSGSLLDNLAAKGITHPNSHVIPSGVDTSHFRPAEKDPHLLLAVGRLIDKKAPLVTIEAFGRLAADFPRHRLEIVGDGPLREQCEALVGRLGLGGRVILHGTQPHEVVHDKLARAAIFVQHSVTDANGNEEGLPIAIQEAMASGAAVVSTRHAGIPDAIDDGLNGHLVAEHDIDGYTAAIRQLMVDPAERERLATAARRKAEEAFDTNRLHRKLENIILEAVQRP